MKKILTMVFFFAALMAKAQSVEVFFYDLDGKYTNIRNAPNGKVVDKVPTSSDGMLLVEEPVNGWWRICDNNYYQPEGGMYKFSGSRSGYYVHYSCIAVSTRNYGGQTLSLSSTPSAKGKLVYHFSNELTLRPLDVKGDWAGSAGKPHCSTSISSTTRVLERMATSRPLRASL